MENGRYYQFAEFIKFTENATNGSPNRLSAKQLASLFAPPTLKLSLFLYTNGKETAQKITTDHQQHLAMVDHLIYIFMVSYVSLIAQEGYMVLPESWKFWLVASHRKFSFLLKSLACLFSFCYKF